jgi:hypothetical protein
MHRKCCVIDRAMVILGSYYWTKQAQSNDENITVVVIQKQSHRTGGVMYRMRLADFATATGIPYEELLQDGLDGTRLIAKCEGENMIFLYNHFDIDRVALVWKIQRSGAATLNMDAVREIGKNEKRAKQANLSYLCDEPFLTTPMRYLEQIYGRSNLRDIAASSSFGEIFRKAAKIWKTGISQEEVERFILR